MGEDTVIENIHLNAIHTLIKNGVAKARRKAVFTKIKFLAMLAGKQLHSHTSKVSISQIIEATQMDKKGKAIKIIQTQISIAIQNNVSASTTTPY